MSKEWTPEEINSEWEKRAHGKYGAELKAESFGLLADVLYGTPPQFNPIEWIKGVKYKPGITFTVNYDPRGFCFVIQLRDSKERFLQVVVDELTLHRLSKPEAQKLFERDVRYLVNEYEKALSDSLLKFPVESDEGRKE